MDQAVWYLKIRLVLVEILFKVFCNQDMYDVAADLAAKRAELVEQIGSDRQAAAEAYTRAADFNQKHGFTEEAHRLYKRSRELSGAPEPVPSGRDLTPEEAEHLKQAFRQAATLMNKQMGNTFPAPGYLDGAVPIDNELLYWTIAGNVEKVEIELQKGENVNKIFTDGLSAGHTALHIAAMGNHVELTKFLLSAGADRDAKTPGITREIDRMRQTIEDVLASIDLKITDTRLHSKPAAK